MSRFLWTFYAQVSRHSFFFLKCCVVACNMAHVQLFQLLSGLIGLTEPNSANQIVCHQIIWPTLGYSVWGCEQVPLKRMESSFQLQWCLAIKGKKTEQMP